MFPYHLLFNENILYKKTKIKSLGFILRVNSEKYRVYYDP